MIGYNDSDFETFAAKQMLTRDHWGACHEVQTTGLALDATVSQGLLTQAFKSKTTISNLTLALFDLFLFQLTKKEQIYVGAQTIKTTVPVWVRMSDDMEFDELMDEVIRSADGALDHQDYDFAHLPKPNVLFAYETICSDGKVPTHDFDLRLVLSRWREGSQLKLEYETSLFSAEQSRVSSTPSRISRG